MIASPTSSSNPSRAASEVFGDEAEPSRTAPTVDYAYLLNREVERAIGEEMHHDEVLRASLRRLRPRKYITRGVEPVMHPPKSESLVRNEWVSTRLDDQVVGCRVRRCAELAVRWQMRLVLNTPHAPQTLEGLRDALLCVDEHMFFQVARASIKTDAPLSQWRDPARPSTDVYALAKTRKASSAVVAQLRRGHRDVSALFDGDNRMLRRAQVRDLAILLQPVMQDETSAAHESQLAPHFAFFASVSLAAQYDLATMGPKSFSKIWRFSPPFNMFDQSLSAAFCKLLPQFAKSSDATERDKLHTRARIEEVEELCTAFTDLTVAYQQY